MSANATTEAKGPSTSVIAMIIAGIFALFYAYAVWNALGNLIAAVNTAQEQGLSLTGLGWFLWIFAMVFPIGVWVVAVMIGLRRPRHHLFLLLLSGLALVAVYWLDLVAYTATNTFSVVS